MGLPSYEKRGLLSDCMTPLPVQLRTAPHKFVLPLRHILHFPQKACTTKGHPLRLEHWAMLCISSWGLLEYYIVIRDWKGAVCIPGNMGLHGRQP